MKRACISIIVATILIVIFNYCTTKNEITENGLSQKPFHFYVVTDVHMTKQRDDFKTIENIRLKN